MFGTLCDVHRPAERTVSAEEYCLVAVSILVDIVGQKLGREPSMK